jgi:hypothetical protein
MARITNIVWTRKPNSFAEVRGRIKSKDIDFESLPLFFPHELWGENNPNPDLMEGFKLSEMPKYFLICRDSNNVYLVNTEGYNYCRYVAKVEVL